MKNEKKHNETSKIILEMLDVKDFITIEQILTPSPDLQWRGKK
jgi:hypothetical protein